MSLQINSRRAFANRCAAGERIAGAASPEPRTLMESSWRDYDFLGVWTRRDRIADRATSSPYARRSVRAPAKTSWTPRRRSVKLGDISLSELREATLQLAVYAGWSRGVALDEAVNTRWRVRSAWRPALIHRSGGALDSARRLADGAASFGFRHDVSGASTSHTAYFQGGIINFVFAEVWMRPAILNKVRVLK